MARVPVNSDRVQELLTECLVPAFAQAGTLRQLATQLNDALRRQGSQETVYPNRLRQLMSDAAFQSVNESTLAAVEQAVQGFPQDETAIEQGFASLTEVVMDRWHATRIHDVPYTAVAGDLNLPPTVVRHVLERSRLLGAAALESAGSSQCPLPGLGGPDWSYQDDAVNRCFAELTTGPGVKIGAILPTGAGKTRIALRISLRMLQADHTGTGVVVWVTHRRTLRRQARRELQKMVASSTGGLEATATGLLAERVKFAMLSEIGTVLADPSRPVVMVVVDEAHHAAAPSYAPIFNAPYPLKGLFITATPNRTDLLPLGIDRIAYSITPRELSDRGVILLPQIIDFPVDDFDWSEAAVKELAGEIAAQSKGPFTKVLVLAPRIDRVEDFYRAVLRAVATELDHPLAQSDIGYVHSNGNPLNMLTDDYLDLFAAKPRAIMVSAQLLLEGFDDPTINTVVVTYETTSLIVLMQAAGRCVRYAPGKTAAFVVQASNPDIAYRFDQRWLYQEISDFLRPDLMDIDYATATERDAVVAGVLANHHIDPRLAQKAIDAVRSTSVGDTCRLLLFGLPYFGERSRFNRDAKWGAIAETPANSSLIREIYNDFCALGADVSDPIPFLRRYIGRDGLVPSNALASDWRTYIDLLTSMYLARGEVYGGMAPTAINVARPYQRNRATTWLKYVTFDYHPIVAPELNRFLEDCFNREPILAELSTTATPFRLAIKIPVPLDGYEAHLLNEQSAKFFTALIGEARVTVGGAAPADRFAQFAVFMAKMGSSPLPARVNGRLELFLPDAGWANLTFALGGQVG